MKSSFQDPGIFSPNTGGNPVDNVSSAQQRRTLLTLLVLAAGFLLGSFSLVVSGQGANNPAWVGFAISGVIGVLLLYAKFDIGIVLLLAFSWMAIDSPDLATGGSGVSKKLQVSQIALVLLLMLWVVRLVMRQGNPRVFRLPFVAPAIFFLLFCVWSTINSFIFPDPNVLQNSYEQFIQVNAFDLGVRLMMLAGVLLLADQLKGRALWWASLAVLVPGVITATRILPFIPVTGWNAFQQVLAMAAFVAFALYKRGPLWLRVIGLLLSASILISLVTVSAEWTSGWATALVALAVVVFLGNRRLFWAGAVVFLILCTVNADYIYQKVWVSNQRGGSFSRFDMMIGATQYASKYPIGIGVGNYRAYNLYYAQTKEIHSSPFSSAHGTYSQTLTETGWVGLVLLIALLSALGVQLYRCWRRLPPGSYERAFALATFGTFIGICCSSVIGDYMFPAYHNGGVGTFASCAYTFFMIGVVFAMAREHGVLFSDPDPVDTEQPIATVTPVIHRPLTAPTDAGAAS